MATNPFDVPQKTYNNFPNDVFIDTCILSYQTAMLPPGPMAETNDDVLSTRFLFGGYILDENNKPKLDANGAAIIARKWTDWMRISFAKNAKMMKVFATGKDGFQNLPDILKDNTSANGLLWKTPFKIMLEASGDYQKITRIKPSSNNAICNEVFYNQEYVPYRVVKAFGKLRELELAGCKHSDGIVTYTPDMMIMPEETKA